MEQKAVAVAELQPDQRQARVEQLVRHIIKSPSLQRKDECEQIAWLVLYGVVDPDVLLRILVITRDSSILKICGTSYYDSETLKKYKITPCDGLRPTNSIKISNPVSVDFKNLLSAKRQKIAPTTSERKASISELAGNSTVSVILTAPDSEISGEYKSLIRQLLLSSISPQEIVHKINKVFKKGSEIEVAEALLGVTLESKVYNNIFGQAAQLLAEGKWNKIFEQVLNRFISSEKFIDAYLEQLRVSASFFAHLIVNGTISFSALSVIKLDMDPEHSSLRIFMDTLLRELKVSMGSSAVSRVLKENATALSGIVNSPLSPEFFSLMDLDLS